MTDLHAGSVLGLTNRISNIHSIVQLLLLKLRHKAAKMAPSRETIIFRVLTTKVSGLMLKMEIVTNQLSTMKAMTLLLKTGYLSQLVAEP